MKCSTDQASPVRNALSRRSEALGKRYLLIEGSVAGTERIMHVKSNAPDPAYRSGENSPDRSVKPGLTAESNQDRLFQ